MPKPIIAVPSVYVTKAALKAFRDAGHEYPVSMLVMQRGDGGEHRTPLYDSETVEGLIAQIVKLDASKFKADNERLRRDNERLCVENDALQFLHENNEEVKETMMLALSWAKINMDLDEFDGDRRGIAHAAHDTEQKLLKKLKGMIKAIEGTPA